MADTIIIRYRLTRELWRRFFEAHYGCERILRLRYLWGVVCIVIACMGFGGYYSSPLVAGLLLATGLFAVLSKPLLVIRSLRGACRHPFFNQVLTVTASSAEIAVRSGNAGYRQPWTNFSGYRQLKPGFLLYLDGNAFFFIPGEAMNASEERALKHFLTAAGVPKR